MMFRLIIIFVLSATLLYAQTGPGGIGTTDGTSTMKMWLDAGKLVYKDTAKNVKINDRERVLFWADKSGSQNDVWARTDSTRPTFISQSPLLNNMPCVLFTRNGGTGNKKNYLSSESFFKTDDITIYAIIHPFTKGGGNDFTPFKLYVIKPSDTLWYNGAGIVDADVFDPRNDVSLSLNSNSIAAGCGDSSTNTDYTIKTLIDLNTSLIASLTKERSTGRLALFKNGFENASIIAGTQTINNAIRYTIGATSNSAKGADLNFFDGYIASVIIYNKILSKAEALILENHLSAKYAIPLPQNDVFTMDEPKNGNYDFDLAGIGSDKFGKKVDRAQGEGIIEINNPGNLDNEEYLLWAHNGESLSFQQHDVSEGVKKRLVRTWRVNEKGEVGNFEIILDTRTIDLSETGTWVLLIDADNDGTFEDSQFGKGLESKSVYLGNGKYAFRNVNINNESRFTFGILKNTCEPDCDNAFSPNGDGISDTYFISGKGKIKIFDKAGQLVKELQTPGFWDGTKISGEVVSPGLYFIVSSETPQQTVTVVR